MGESQIERLQRKIDALKKRAAEEKSRVPTADSFARNNHRFPDGSVKQIAAKKPVKVEEDTYDEWLSSGVMHAY